MEFEVVFEKCNPICCNFADGQYEIHDSSEDELPIIHGNIILNDENIGYITLLEFCDIDNFYELCDIFSGDSEAIACAVCNKSGKISRRFLPDKSTCKSVCILDKIVIEDRFRGMGIGAIIINNIFNIIHNKFGVSVIFLNASDFESANKYGFESLEYKNGTSRLINFYKKAGFKIIKNNIMFIK